MDAFGPSTQDGMTFDSARGAPRLEAGSPQPLGANWTGRGTNFAVFSAHADRVELCLFDASGRNEVARLDLPSRTGNLWHGFLPARFGGPGLQYGYRVHGALRSSRGHALQSVEALVESVRAIAARDASSGIVTARGRARVAMTSLAATAPRTLPACRSGGRRFDWAKVRHRTCRGATRSSTKWHVKGFTAAASACRRTCAARISGLPSPAVIRITQQLGVTTIELMPVQAFVSEQFSSPSAPRQLLGLQLARVVRARAQLRVEDARHRIQTMVRALHEAGSSHSSTCLNLSTTRPKATSTGDPEPPAASTFPGLLPAARRQPFALRQFLRLRQHDQLRRARRARDGGRLPA